MTSFFVSLVILVTFVIVFLTKETTTEDVCPGQISVCEVIGKLFDKIVITQKIIKGLDYDLDLDLEPFPCILNPENYVFCENICDVMGSLINLGLYPTLVDNIMTKILGREPQCDDIKKFNMNENPYHVVLIS